MPQTAAQRKAAERNRDAKGLRVVTVLVPDHDVREIETRATTLVALYRHAALRGDFGDAVKNAWLSDNTLTA
jgi:hypothetical protein